MSVTYSPDTQQVFGLFVGYDPESDDVQDMTARLRRNRDFVKDPFILLSTFLEIEQNHRISQVEDMVDKLQSTIEAGKTGVRGRSRNLEAGQRQQSSFVLNNK
ncbi:Fc.00g027610.m01.CDS01 [Cosmosporella sp. VM-42]